MSSVSSIKRFITSPYYILNFGFIIGYFVARQTNYFPSIQNDMLIGDDLTGIPRVKIYKYI